MNGSDQNIETKIFDHSLMVADRFFGTAIEYRGFKFWSLEYLYNHIKNNILPISND